MHNIHTVKQLNNTIQESTLEVNQHINSFFFYILKIFDIKMSFVFYIKYGTCNHMWSPHFAHAFPKQVNLIHEFI